MDDWRLRFAPESGAHTRDAHVEQTDSAALQGQRIQRGLFPQRLFNGEVAFSVNQPKLPGEVRGHALVELNWIEATFPKFQLLIF